MIHRPYTPAQLAATKRNLGNQTEDEMPIDGAKVDPSDEEVAKIVLYLKGERLREHTIADRFTALLARAKKAEKERDDIAARLSATTVLVRSRTENLLDVASERDSALAALAEARRENAWRPIESAPRDGTPIIVDHHGFHSVCVCMWWRAGEAYAYHWRKLAPLGGIMIPVDPDKWRPLPPPPAEGEGR